ncbi:MAG: helix-turn-helix domain-containing protein [Ferruginibacter sp.]|nr:helix-turn-helix domain-containing protein [Ferruginibacter sp.]
MSVEIVTKEDLQAFRLQLLNDLKAFLLPPVQSEKKEWLRSREIRKMLRISPGTLQNMRINGKISPSKIGGIFFYRKDDIDKLLDSNDEPLISA